MTITLKCWHSFAVCQKVANLNKLVHESLQWSWGGGGTSPFVSPLYSKVVLLKGTSAPVCLVEAGLELLLS